MSPKTPTPLDLVELHFYREDGATAFLVVVPDAALIKLNERHPIRGLTTSFNIGGPKSKRLFALASAVKEAEDAGAVREKPAGRIRRASRAVARFIVGLIYPAVRWVRAMRKGASQS